MKEETISELRSKLLSFVVDVGNSLKDEKYASFSTIIDHFEEQINQWHKSEREKWALELLQTIIEEGDCLPDGLALEIVTQIREKIEEG